MVLKSVLLLCGVLALCLRFVSLAKQPTLNEATANWAVEMLRRVGAEPTDSVFFSPASVAVALGMAYAGADNATARQFNDVLFTGLSENEVHEGFSRLVAAWKAPKDKYELTTVNNIFAQTGFELLYEYYTKLETYYQAGMMAVDFTVDPDATAVGINKWIEQVTNNKIQNLIAPGVLNKLTRMVLVNAIHFKGKWRNTFEPSKTYKQSFYCTPSQEQQVDMMHQTTYASYAETDEVQVLGLAYEGTSIATFVLLPKKRFGLAEFERGLTGTKLIQLIDATSDKRVEISLPKFKLESQFSLADHLKAMGMPDAFDDNADFSRITGAKDLVLSHVEHKAFVEVNEEGSEAAAATAVEFGLGAGAPTFDQPPVITVDHPFLVVYADRHPDALVCQLFLGRYAGC